MALDHPDGGRGVSDCRDFFGEKDSMSGSNRESIGGGDRGRDFEPPERDSSVEINEISLSKSANELSIKDTIYEGFLKSPKDDYTFKPNEEFEELEILFDSVSKFQEEMKSNDFDAVKAYLKISSGYSNTSYALLFGGIGTGLITYTSLTGGLLLATAITLGSVSAALLAASAAYYFKGGNYIKGGLTLIRSVIALFPSLNGRDFGKALGKDELLNFVSDPVDYTRSLFEKSPEDKNETQELKNVQKSKNARVYLD